ncbi:hypothetical protein OIV83_000237 [Microbotryomycetes sp. JL201]|nr:hypothetical protein OIV83_000237 [Microbotryomycetes sp. JL201]
MSGQPNVTLHVSNLDSKVKKDETRRTLYALFSAYGKVLDVVHKRGTSTRGQAFVVFRDLASSTAALRGLDGEGFYGRQLRITYAKSTSYATVAATEGQEAVYQIKLGLRTVDGKKLDGSRSKMTVSGAQQKLIEQAKKAKRAREEEDDEEEEDEDESDQEGAGPNKKKGKIAADDDEMEMEEDSDDDTAAAAVSAPKPAIGETPNQILFVEGLPAEVTSDMLQPLFQQYPGLASLRLLPLAPNSPPNSGTAFVHYDSVAQAKTAKEALDQFLLAPQVPMRVSWAKRA